MAGARGRHEARGDRRAVAGEGILLPDAGSPPECADTPAPWCAFRRHMVPDSTFVGLVSRPHEDYRFMVSERFDELVQHFFDGLQPILLYEETDRAAAVLGGAYLDALPEERLGAFSCRGQDFDGAAQRSNHIHGPSRATPQPNVSVRRQPDPARRNLPWPPAGSSASSGRPGGPAIDSDMSRHDKLLAQILGGPTPTSASRRSAPCCATWASRSARGAATTCSAAAGSRS
jgi:hypothetical protein